MRFKPRRPPAGCVRWPCPQRIGGGPQLEGSASGRLRKWKAPRLEGSTFGRQWVSWGYPGGIGGDPGGYPWVNIVSRIFSQSPIWRGDLGLVGAVLGRSWGAARAFLGRCCDAEVAGALRAQSYLFLVAWPYTMLPKPTGRVGLESCVRVTPVRSMAKSIVKNRCLRCGTNISWCRVAFF